MSIESSSLNNNQVTEEVKTDQTEKTEDAFDKIGILDTILDAMNQETFDLLKIDKNKDPASMSDPALQYDHAILHYRFQKVIDGTKYKSWSQEDFVNYHVLIVNELKSRKMPHFPYNDELDSKSKEFEKKYMVVNPSGNVLGERIFLDEILNYLESFKIRHPYISLVGGLVVHGNTEGDIDILIKDSLDAPDEYKHILEWRILRGLPQGLWDRVQFHWGDKFFGPFTDYIELYDMTIERINRDNKKIEMSFKDYDFSKQRAGTPEIKREAEQSIKEDKIELFRFFIPLKTSISPFMAYRLAEMYKIDRVIDHLKGIAEKKKLKTEIPEVFVQKKYDGARHVIHRKGDKVIIYSDDGSDNTKRLPSVVEEVQRLKGDELILDSEIELWEGKKHQPRENLSGFLHAKGDPDDSGIVCNVFDLLFIDGQDLHKTPQKERFTKLEKLGIKQSTIDAPNLDIKLNLSPTDIISNPKSLEKSIKKYTDSIASEGAMIKLADSTYPLTGITTEVIKYKKYVEVHAIIWKVNQTKVATVYNYDVALAVSAGQKVAKDSLITVEGKTYSKIGRTYNTDIKAKVGDNLTVSFHTINYYFDAETGEYRLHLYEPRVVELLGKEEKPDFLEEAIRIGKESGLLEEKTEKDFDEKKYHIDTSKHFEKAVDPFMIIPPEDEKYKYVVQQHWRGKSLHADFRVESLNKTSLIGWTLMVQIAGSIDEPITTLDQAKKYTSSKYSKIDWNTGEWAQRVKAGTQEKTNVEIVSERKAIEPPEWKDVEGVVPQGEVGATKEFPGIFHIVDRGQCEYGTQKPWIHEYFCKTDRGKGGLKGRYIFRQLETEAIGKNLEEDIEDIIGEEILDIKKITLPASETEFRQEAAWFCIKPLDQTPYVLSNRAIEKKYVPPKDVSALPEYIKNQIPKEYHYWTKDSEKDRLELRDQLISKMKEDQVNVNIEKMEKLSQTDAKFVFQYQEFRKKGQKPVRPGATYWEYHLRVDTGKNYLMHWVSENNPIETEEAAAYYRREDNKSYMEIQGDIPPGHPLNQTKETQSRISILDKGKCIVMIDDPNFKKVEFMGETLKGLWIISRQDGVWAIKRTERAPRVKED